MVSGEGTRWRPPGSRRRRTLVDRGIRFAVKVPGCRETPRALATYGDRVHTDGDMRAGRSRRALRAVTCAIGAVALFTGAVIAFAPYEKPVTYPISKGTSLGIVAAISECGAPAANMFRDDPTPDQVVKPPGAPFSRIRVSGFACQAPSRRRAAGGLLLVTLGVALFALLLVGRRRRQLEIKGPIGAAAMA